MYSSRYLSRDGWVRLGWVLEAGGSEDGKKTLFFFSFSEVGRESEDASWRESEKDEPMRLVF